MGYNILVTEAKEFEKQIDWIIHQRKSIKVVDLIGLLFKKGLINFHFVNGENFVSIEDGQLYYHPEVVIDPSVSLGVLDINSPRTKIQNFIQMLQIITLKIQE